MNIYCQVYMKCGVRAEQTAKRSYKQEFNFRHRFRMRATLRKVALTGCRAPVKSGVDARRSATALHVWRCCIFVILLFALPLLSESSDLTTPDGFAVPQEGQHFEFPRDHGSHPEFKIEWWYVTGHLQSISDPQRFSYQATFFRRSATTNTTDFNSTFGTSQVYLAHMALLDVSSGKFLQQERLNRSGWDASSELSTLAARNGNWSLELQKDGSTMGLLGTIRNDATFQLSLKPLKPLVVFGTNSVSRKGADSYAASHYLTFTRLQTTGSLTLEGKTFQVSGLSWMDHEMSSGQLSTHQVGWDWCCIQLKDGREIMVYLMRRDDGSLDPFSTLAWIDRDGTVRHFGGNSFQLQTKSRWKSSQTGADYPIERVLVAPNPEGGPPFEFVLRPLARAQELTGKLGGVAYWEGGCRVENARGEEIGQAFLELTGYAGDLQKSFR